MLILVASQWAETPWLHVSSAEWWGSGLRYDLVSLAVVLEALCRPPFESIEEISERLLTSKTVLILAIYSLKRVEDLQAFSVAPSYLDFVPSLAKAFLYPRAGYVPKVPSSTPRPVVLQAFCPPPFREPDQKRLNCMCPVRALDAYVHRAALWRRADQLLVCYGPPKKGLPPYKQTLSWWIVDHSFLWVPWSPLTIGGQDSLYKKYGGLQGLSGRCTYAGHLRHCWLVYAPQVCQVLRPISTSHSWLFCSLAIGVPSHTKQGFASLAAWTSRFPSVFDTARVPGGEYPRLRM